MKLVDIKDRIITVLGADSDLIALPVKKVFEGIRDRVSDDDYPFIVVEPIQNEEIGHEINTKAFLKARFSIAGFIKEYEADDQLDLIFDFENKIKKALSSGIVTGGDITNNIVNFNFTTTAYDVELWPVRGVIITLEVEYRQTFKTRT